MIPLTSWMALWCTNTGYSVSQGCSMSCFLCLWAVGRQVRWEKAHHRIGRPAESSLEGSQLQHLQALIYLQVAPLSESSQNTQRRGRAGERGKAKEQNQSSGVDHSGQGSRLGLRAPRVQLCVTDTLAS